MRRWIAAVVLTLFLAASGCSNESASPTPTGSDSTGPSPSRSPSPSPSPPPEPAPTFDPPLAFEPEGVEVMAAADGIEFSERDYAVSADALYAVVNGRLIARSLATGERLWSQPLVGSSAVVPFITGPKIARVGGRDLVFAAYFVTLEGTGTTADRQAINVYAYDALDGAVVWNISIDNADVVPQGLEDGEIGVAAANGKYVVVSTTPEVRSDVFTAVVDAATGKVRWTRELFYAVSLDGETIAGLDGADYDEVLAARSANSGATVWSRKRPIVSTNDGVVHLTTGLIAVVHGESTLVVNVSNGATVIDTGDYFDRCLHDQQAVVVCQQGLTLQEPPPVVAWDAKTGKRLWSLPDEDANRVAPAVTAAWHGVVYGETENGPVILDARTGRDKRSDVLVAPDRVITGYGLLVGGLILTYRATG